MFVRVLLASMIYAGGTSERIEVYPEAACPAAATRARPATFCSVHEAAAYAAAASDGRQKDVSHTFRSLQHPIHIIHSSPYPAAASFRCSAPLPDSLCADSRTFF